MTLHQARASGVWLAGPLAGEPSAHRIGAADGRRRWCCWTVWVQGRGQVLVQTYGVIAP